MGGVRASLFLVSLEGTDVGKHVEVNPGEMFMVADKLILVDSYESVLGDAQKIGSDKHRAAYMFTFTGRVNHTDERTSVTVAVPLAEAYELAAHVVKWIEEFAVANGMVLPE